MESVWPTAMMTSRLIDRELADDVIQLGLDDLRASGRLVEVEERVGGEGDLLARPGPASPSAGATGAGAGGATGAIRGFGRRVRGWRCGQVTGFSAPFFALGRTAVARRPVVVAPAVASLQCRFSRRLPSDIWSSCRCFRSLSAVVAAGYTAATSERNRPPHKENGGDQ